MKIYYYVAISPFLKQFIMLINHHSQKNSILLIKKQNYFKTILIHNHDDYSSEVGSSPFTFDIS